MKITAYRSDGLGGVKVVEVDEPEEQRIEREKREKLAALTDWLQANGVDTLTNLSVEVPKKLDKTVADATTATLEARIVALEKKIWSHP
jgi:hypothetical protein